MAHAELDRPKHSQQTRFVIDSAERSQAEPDRPKQSRAESQEEQSRAGQSRRETYVVKYSHAGSETAEQ